MTEQTTTAVRFKRYTNADMQYLRVWAEFPDCPPELEAWFTAQTGVTSTLRSALDGKSVMVHFKEYAFSEGHDLTRDVLALIAAAGEFLGRAFTPNDLGLYLPPQPGSDDLPAGSYTKEPLVGADLEEWLKLMQSAKLPPGYFEFT